MARIKDVCILLTSGVLLLIIIAFWNLNSEVEDLELPDGANDPGVASRKRVDLDLADKTFGSFVKYDEPHPLTQPPLATTLRMGLKVIKDGAKTSARESYQASDQGSDDYKGMNSLENPPYKNLAGEKDIVTDHKWSTLSSNQIDLVPGALSTTQVPVDREMGGNKEWQQSAYGKRENDHVTSKVLDKYMVTEWIGTSQDAFANDRDSQLSTVFPRVNPITIKVGRSAVTPASQSDVIVDAKPVEKELHAIKAPAKVFAQSKHLSDILNDKVKVSLSEEAKRIIDNAQLMIELAKILRKEKRMAYNVTSKSFQNKVRLQLEEEVLSKADKQNPKAKNSKRKTDKKKWKANNIRSVADEVLPYLLEKSKEKQTDNALADRKKKSKESLTVKPLKIENIKNDKPESLERNLEDSTDFTSTTDKSETVTATQGLIANANAVTSGLKTERRKSPVKKILLHNTFWEDWEVGTGSEPFRRLQCEVKDCTITTDTTEFETSDAVVFHIHQLPENPPPTHPPNQRWVFFMLESPAWSVNYNYKQPQWRSQFNWTMTYKIDSDVRLYYGLLRKAKVPQEDNQQNLRKFRAKKLAAWFVSNCNTPGRREHYVKKLQKYMPVDVYGRCGNMTCVRNMTTKDADCSDYLQQNYKFYLAFENGMCKDYVTEKFYKTLPLDVVPVVMGGANYARFSPRKWYINAEDFQTPEKLANYLRYLAETPREYYKYLKARNAYEFETFLGIRQLPSWCDLCKKLHSNEPAKSYSDIRSWWGRYECRKPRWMRSSVTEK